MRRAEQSTLHRASVSIGRIRSENRASGAVRRRTLNYMPVVHPVNSAQKRR
jgi:hypothetical protein